VADLRTLTLALVADVDKFKKGLDTADKESRTFSDKLGSVLKKGALAFAALGAAAGAFAIKLGKDAITAASDFNEELSKSQVILGDGAAEVEKFARTAARSLGQSRTEALRAAGNFAIFGKSAGLSGKDLADFSTDFVTLASDLASFNNTSPEDAINAIGAALRGEAEPIRRYGILLNDAALKQQALKLGIIETTSEALTPQQKVLAAQAEIYAQTSDAQGDFARTSEGLANQQRILKASLEDVKIELGERLLPIAVDVANYTLDNLLPAFEGLVRGLTGGSKSVKGATKETESAFAELGIVFNDNDTSAYDLGVALKELAGTLSELFANVDTGSAEDSGLVKFIKLIERIVTAIDSAIEKVRTLNRVLTLDNPFSQLGLRIGESISGDFTGSRAESQARLESIAGSQRRPNTQPITVNVRGAIDPQGTARAISKVFTSQTSISGVKITAPSAFGL
jgi:hypothetical protein